MGLVGQRRTSSQKTSSSSRRDSSVPSIMSLSPRNAIASLPAAAARFWAVGIGGMIVVAVAVAMLATVIGLLLSYYFSLPSGPTVILVAGIGYGLSIVFGPAGGLIAQASLRRHYET